MSTVSNEPVPYMARTRAYYEAQGFDKPYRYAHHQEAPFAPLPRPLAECTVGLVVTAATYPRASLEPRKVDSGPTQPPPQRLYGDDLSWDKEATHLDDVASFCPIPALSALVERGRLGAIASRFHCAPTEYSHRATTEHDAPELHRRLLEDGADVALLVPL